MLILCKLPIWAQGNPLLALVSEMSIERISNTDEFVVVNDYYNLPIAIGTKEECKKLIGFEEIDVAFQK